MIIAALSLLSLMSIDISRSREIYVPRSIERTAVRLGAGLVSTYGNEGYLGHLPSLLEGDLGEAKIYQPKLYVNGQGGGHYLFRVFKAAWKMGLFVLDKSDFEDSVVLQYIVRYQGLFISRCITVEEGQICSSTTFPCSLGPQGRCKRVWVFANARETKNGTSIRLTVTVRVNSGLCPQRGKSRCGLVNRIVRNQTSAQLDSMLADAEREGRRLSSRGHDVILRIPQCLVNSLSMKWNQKR